MLSDDDNIQKVMIDTTSFATARGVSKGNN